MAETKIKLSDIHDGVWLIGGIVALFVWWRKGKSKPVKPQPATGNTTTPYRDRRHL